MGAVRRTTIGWAGTSYLGVSHGRSGAITVFQASDYTAIYIANPADSQSTPDDLQFLYNAIIFPPVG